MVDKPRGLSKCESPFCVGAFDLQRCRPRGGYLIWEAIYQILRQYIVDSGLVCKRISLARGTISNISVQLGKLHETLPLSQLAPVMLNGHWQ